MQEYPASLASNQKLPGIQRSKKMQAIMMRKKINQKIVHCKRKEQLTWEHSKRHHLKSNTKEKVSQNKNKKRSFIKLWDHIKWPNMHKIEVSKGKGAGEDSLESLGQQGDQIS